MGHHFIPRAYLRHFACQGQHDYVWVYDKKEREWGQPLPIAVTAQAPEFYTHDTEVDLAAVEGDAHEPLEKLRNAEQLTGVDREKVCKYLCAFAARSPFGRRAMLSLNRAWIEGNLNGFASDLARQEIPVTEAEQEWFRARRRRRETVDPFRTRSVLVRGFPSHFSNDSSLLPRIFLLRWLVLRRPSSGEFVTGDSPFAVGPHHYQFPLSTDLCLVCQGGRLQSTAFLDCQERLARCINRKTVQWSERFVYASSQHGWVPKIAEEAGRRDSPVEDSERDTW